MNDKFSNLSKKDDIKEKIRKRYQGGNSNLREMIPAEQQPDFHDDTPRKVAVYVRVSTDDPRQTSSYELQKNYYENLVKDHENWTLVDIYADEGISGTSRVHRDSFNKMINDCKEGKIDIIITKSVSRFSRNIVDCISISRELALLKTPVGVYFETEHLFTLDKDAEMHLSFIATMAQEESHTKSTSMNASLEMRFANGILLTPAPLGYDNDENGNLIINEEEAQTIRLIFFLYLYGYSCRDIAEKLTILKLKTKKDNTEWNAGSVLQILRNERYCGDVMARKTFTPNYLDHKTRKNYGQRNRYLWRNQHEAIITHDDYIAVQHLIDNAKYGNKGIMPELTSITEGRLSGFVKVNIHWSGFTAQDYISVYEKCKSIDENKNQDEVRVQKGDFDLRGFEVASSHYFEDPDKLYVTFSTNKIIFSQTCIRKLNDIQYIELLAEPKKALLAARKTDKNDKNSMRWAKLDNRGKYATRIIWGTAFLETIYDLFQWNKKYKYRIPGKVFSDDTPDILMFDVSQAALLFSEFDFKNGSDDSNNSSPLLPIHGKTMIAFPETLADHFGQCCYDEQISDNNDHSEEKTVSYSGFSGLNVTASETVADNIQNIIQNVKGDSYE